MPHVSHLCQLINVQIWDNYVSIYASYEPNTINNVTRNTDIHTFHIIGICPWTNLPVTLHIYVPHHYYCGLHRDPTLYTSQKIKQQSTKGTPHIIVKYVPETNMPLKSIYMCQICLVVYVLKSDNYVSIYTSYKCTAVISVTRTTPIHTFNITDICLWTNMSTTSHMYVPLH